MAELAPKTPVVTSAPTAADNKKLVKYIIIALVVAVIGYFAWKYLVK